MTVPWYDARMCGLDFETTGTDPATDRIVTGCVTFVGGDRPTRSLDWLTDVDGQDIPQEAAAVHGITTDQARSKGVPMAEAVTEISHHIRRATAAKMPIVAMNARFDLTLLDRELRRLGMDPLDAQALRVVDPYVLDKHVERYRRGKRTLAALCTRYRVELSGAHTAAGDAVAACRVAWRIAHTYPPIADLPLDALHTAQIKWAAEQAESLQEHFRKSDPTAFVDPAWPVSPFTEQEPSDA